MGYQHIDTAQIYDNERFVGNARRVSEKKREDLRITTKIWFEAYDHVIESVEASLKKLQTEYLDLLLLHWPSTEQQDLKVFEQLISLQQAGKIKHLGVSNFTVKQLELMSRYFPNKIFTNQIERSVCLDQSAMYLFARDREILVTAYSPLGHGHLLQLSGLKTIAEKHQSSVAQVALAWLLRQEQVVTIAKASSSERLKENLAAERVILDEEDLLMIDQLPKNYRYCNPPFAPLRDQ